MSKFNLGLRALLICTSATVFLSACASTPEECDPREDQGFFGKIGCVVTGSYEDRITTREETVEDLKEENARLNNLIRAINYQDALIRGDMATRQRELDKVRGELYALQNQLAAKKKLDSQLQQKFKDVNNQLTKIQSTPASATIAEKERQIAELESTLDELSAQMMEGM